jgi:hypothetical protein
MITTNIFFMLLIKHFICDFPLQAFPYQYRNKGTYGHLGGILYSGMHVMGSMMVLAIYTDYRTAIMLSLFDGIMHYHIDWAKMNIGKKYVLKPDNSEWFWILMGFDQFLHALTYYIMVVCIVMMGA